MRQALHDLAALVARLGVGGIFFANGWHKLEDGLKTTGTHFAQQGAPAPRAWATVTMLAELIGGALLIAGLLVALTGLVLFAEALAVFLVAPPLNPITVNELVLLGVAALLLAVVGAGRVSVDHMVVIRRRESEAASEFAADTEADRVIASLREPDAPASASAGEADTARPPGTSSGVQAPGASSAAQAPGGAHAPGASGGGQDPGASGEQGTASSATERTGPAASAARARARTDAEKSDRQDTAPHPRARRPASEPPPADEPPTSPSPGDTLVAGRKKPAAPRTRRAQPDE
ncbi:DoxX family protein [Nonomuraea rhodomycinica]|uniref:DoxX family membrane protein n=1 Tax=Nonomuraea rhodomycinica TaxID=1712872 RepID=A0A7Y6MDV5_9ACTN|nr:DoxX family protein [Nonomuraea rhodomycinica]NUW43009.1 DoxX family membrane protein [Nonomuraea rhodomycinica]